MLCEEYDSAHASIADLVELFDQDFNISNCMEIGNLGAGAMSTSAQENINLWLELELSEQVAAEFKLPELLEASVINEHN